MLDDYIEITKFHYDCGDYRTAFVALENVLFLTGGVLATPRGLSFLWGRLACSILTGSIEDGLELIREVKQVIEAKGGSALEQLQQRSWLLHWSIFIFFSHSTGRDELISMFFEEKFLQAIQTNSPWLLRYLVASVILTRGTGVGSNKQMQIMRDLIRVLEQEQGSYSDPIIQFLECLYVHFDFDGAKSKKRM
jgi:translation initiation factor 3 subunit E